MKVELNTVEKTIKIQESVEIGEFIDMCKNLFPNNIWRGFTLETNTIIEWINPIPWTYPIYYEGTTAPIWPPDRTWITCSGNSSPDEYTTNIQLTPGTFCIDYIRQ